MAPLTPEQERARELLGDYSPGSFDDLSQIALENALSGKPSYDLSPEKTAEYFREAVTEPLLKTFEDRVVPNIEAEFANLGGTFSSRRGETVRRSLGDLQDSLASQLGQAQLSNQQLSAQLSESALERQLQGIGLAEQFDQRGLTRASALQEASSPFAAYAQAKARARYQEFLRRLPTSNPAVGQALQFTGQQQTNTIVDNSPSPFEQALGFGGTVLGGYLGGAF